MNNNQQNIQINNTEIDKEEFNAENEKKVDNSILIIVTFLGLNIVLIKIYYLDHFTCNDSYK